MEKQSKRYRIEFYVSYCVILATIFILFMLYCTFNGGISTSSSDWSNFATFLGSIGTMLFTALNVWVFFHLTLSIAQNESQFVLQERQIACINKFSHAILFVFPNSSNESACDVKEDILEKALDLFKNFKKHKDILPTLNGKSYEEFITQYQDFCLKYRDYSYYQNLGNRDAYEQIFNGNQPEEEYYKLYCTARGIYQQLIGDIISIEM